MGLHPRCGNEDTIIGQHGQRFGSVDQVKQTVRVAKELGREIATGKEARQIYRIGTWYKDADETLAANGMLPNWPHCGPDRPLGPLLHSSPQSEIRAVSAN